MSAPRRPSRRGLSLGALSPRGWTHAPAACLLAFLRLYKLAVSPYLGARCRFYPSCSDYAREAIQYHGAARGSYLALKRLCRCHPFSSGGFDPIVPPASETCPRSSSSEARSID